MTVLQINTVYLSGSTGKICWEIAKLCHKNGIKNYIACANDCSSRDNDEIISVTSWLDNHIHNRLSRITMFTGCFSYLHTVSFLRKIKKINPDIIHLHNLHGNYINIKLLFKYIKKNDIPVIWTLHDCWSYTGYCAYYEIVECDKWKNQCENCPNRYFDSVTLFDNSKKMYKFKKRLFTGVKRMLLITPSQWLNREVKQSFLKDYPAKIINNGIDLSVFKPTESDFRKKYNCEDKHIVLGVAFGWGERKGLDVFVELSARLPENYQIVLVGTNDSIDKLLPENIISVHRTRNQKELAEIYTAADVFANPTREEMFGLVNIESLACGTPVVTFQTGGSPECLDETCGTVVPKNDIDSMEKEIIRICETKPYSEDSCLKRAGLFDKDERFNEYLDLYRSFK